MDKKILLQKIWGSWTGKVAGGTFGMLMIIFMNMREFECNLECNY